MNVPVYNCGCFTWMHGTGEDACDLYLPEMKPTLGMCPLVTHRREDLLRRLAEATANEAASRARFLAQMPECNRRLYETATGEAQRQSQASMSLAAAHQASLVGQYEKMQRSDILSAIGLGGLFG
jgi:hypothetical protein